METVGTWSRLREGIAASRQVRAQYHRYASRSLYTAIPQLRPGQVPDIAYVAALHLYAWHSTASLRDTLPPDAAHGLELELRKQLARTCGHTRRQLAAHDRHTATLASDPSSPISRCRSRTDTPTIRS